MPEQMINLDLSLVAAAINLAFAALLGALIGSERQMRQRMAGLRTNALVALGAAGFVTFAALFPSDINPTRVAAQVVSGIGFLGAGIIFRDGFNVHGLNTAATLWCSAAVGMMAGAGHLPYAAVLTGLIVFINLALRPIVRLINKFTLAKPSKERLFQLRLRCARTDEREMRAFLVRNLAVNNLYLNATEVDGDDKEVEIIANIHGEGATERNIERSISQIAMEPRITRTFWCAMDDLTV
jgi:putative Mg2+ transporter-C (MgtC) family protein